MKKVIGQIPNLITSLGLSSGTLAIFFAVDGHLIWAGLFICLAALFDFVDGFSARLLHAKTEIGKHLDSFADIISFGVAPAAILFTLLEFSMFKKNLPIHEISAKGYEWFILFSSLLIPVFGAIRLAKFNTKIKQENFFRGLPIPANGLFWAALGLMLEFSNRHFVMEAVYSTKNLVLFAVFLSGLMVVNLPMFSLKFKSINLRENWHRFVFLGVSLALLLIFSATGLVLIILFYILLNVMFYLFGVKI